MEQRAESKAAAISGKGSPTNAQEESKSGGMDSEVIRTHDQEYASVSRKLESEADVARSPNQNEAKTPAENE